MTKRGKINCGLGLTSALSILLIRSTCLSKPSPSCLSNRRKQRYQSAPRNIHRHVLLSEIKEATSTLPLVRNNHHLHFSVSYSDNCTQQIASPVKCKCFGVFCFFPQMFLVTLPWLGCWTVWGTTLIEESILQPLLVTHLSVFSSLSKSLTVNHRIIYLSIIVRKWFPVNKHTATVQRKRKSLAEPDYGVWLVESS